MRRKGIWLAVAAVTAVVAVAAVVGWSTGVLYLPWTRTHRGRDPRERIPVEPPPPGFERATFGGGCFWCTEAIFLRLKGVHSVVPGYSGGWVKDPAYEQVRTTNTGHAEVVQVTYDPAVVSYAELLEVFWATHDPTTPNRQGADNGPQYRSVIFYHSEEQREQAERSKRKLDESGAFGTPIVTEIVPFTEFYAAEAYHEDYFGGHPRQPYCTGVIRPKVEKFERAFKGKVKAP
jgi:peptide-methionine (S)-S-oxide reductase